MMRQSSAILIMLSCLLPAGAAANTIINYTVTPLGGNSYRYNYQFSGLSLLANQELDIQFDAAKYGTLSAGVAPAPFQLLLFQPNQPVGAAGVYSIFTAVANPATTGTFSVNFIYTSTGLPGGQQFFIYDDNFSPLHLVEQGTTTLAGVSGVPEPSGFWLGCSALLTGCLGLAVRGRWLSLIS